MSMCHKAYAFDWPQFSIELLPTLLDALQTNSSDRLVTFVEANLVACKEPYEGQSLGHDWQAQLEKHDIQEIADYALTKYYDPAHDHGVHEEWSTIDAGLTAQGKAALLGLPVCVQSICFDPGQQGSYFQDPSTVASSLQVLDHANEPRLRSFVAFLKQSLSKGIYVTF